MNKYSLYQASVQNPIRDVETIETIFQNEVGVLNKPLVLREDFCGTFRLSKAWVERSNDRSATVFDLDAEPLNFGKKSIRKNLLKRINIKNLNVLTPTPALADVIAAFNFSFNVFKKRTELVQYFKVAKKSLKKNGILVLEVAGGPGMIQKSKEQKKVKLNNSFFTYVWDQKNYDPITSVGSYAIHFMSNKNKRSEQKLMNAFTYDWRIWTLTELQDALCEAGFSKVKIYWERFDRKNNSYGYLETKTATNDWAYVCYVVGVKGGLNDK